MSPAVVAAPRVLVESDVVLTTAQEVPATAVEVSLQTGAPPGPSAAPPSGDPADPLCSGEGWQQRRGADALASLRRPGDAAAFDLSFEPGRSDVLGLAAVGGAAAGVVRSCGHLRASLLRHVVAHELGHLVDGARMTEPLRDRWKAARGIPAGTPWYGGNACSDFATPAGDFAEVYAQWQTGAGTNRSELAGSPSPVELADLAAGFF